MRKRTRKAAPATKTSVQDLAPRNAHATKGGAAYTSADLAADIRRTLGGSANPDVTKAIGEALNTAARGG